MLASTQDDPSEAYLAWTTAIYAAANDDVAAKIANAVSA